MHCFGAYCRLRIGVLDIQVCYIGQVICTIAFERALIPRMLRWSRKRALDGATECYWLLWMSFVWYSIGCQGLPGFVGLGEVGLLF